MKQKRRNLRAVWNKFVSVVEQRVPIIPDFGDLNNIWRLMWMGPLLCIIYTILSIDASFLFFDKFPSNIRVFTPFFVMNVLGLIVFSKPINRLSPFRATMLIFLINALSVSLVYFLLFGDSKDFFSASHFTIYYIASASICFFFLIYFDWRERAMDPANTIAKLSALQAKMHPHFLFNTINSVVAMVKKNPELARKMLLNLSDLLRVSLQEDNPKELGNVGEEVGLVVKFLEIEKIRLGTRLTLDLQVSDGVNDFPIPKFILQPLVENAIGHGISRVHGGGVLSIKIDKNLMERLTIEIKNPCEVISTKEKKKAGSGYQITMKNIAERLRIYYEGSATFKYEKVDDSFYVFMEIPRPFHDFGK